MVTNSDPLGPTEAAFDQVVPGIANSFLEAFDILGDTASGVKNWLGIGSNDYEASEYLVLEATSGELGSLIGELLLNEWSADHPEMSLGEIRANDEFNEQFRLLLERDYLIAEGADQWEIAQVESELNATASHIIPALEAKTYPQGGGVVLDRHGNIIESPDLLPSDEQFSDFLLNSSVEGDTLYDTLGPKLQWLASQEDAIFAEYESSGLTNVPFNQWLEVAWPPERLDYEYFNSQPIGSYSPDQEVELVDSTLSYLWRNLPSNMATQVRKAIINDLRDRQGTFGLTRDEAMASLVSQGDIYRVMDEGIFTAIRRDNPYGDRIVEYLTTHGLSPSDFLTPKTEGWTPYDRSSAPPTLDDFYASIDDPAFAAIFRTPLDPEAEKARAALSLNQKILDSLPVDTRRIPWLLQEQLFARIAGSVPLDSEGALEAFLSDIDFDLFVTQNLSQLIEEIAPGAGEQIDNIFGGDVWEFIRVGLMPRDVYTAQELQDVIIKELAPPQITDEEVRERVRAKLNPEIANLPESFQASIIQAVENDLAGRADAAGTSIDGLVAQIDLAPLVELAVRSQLEGLANFEEIELLAQINAGGSLTELLAQIEGENITLAQAVEALEETEAAAPIAGEDQATLDARDRLSTIRSRRQAAEAAEEVAAQQQLQTDIFDASPQGQQLRARAEQEQRERTNDAYIQRFVAEPAAQFVETEIGRGFTSRSANLLTRTLGAEIVRDREAQFRLQQEQNPTLTIEDFQRTNPLETRLGDRQSLVGRLREEQAQQRVLFAPAARRRVQLKEGGR